MPLAQRRDHPRQNSEHGSVLVIVLWVAFGLVSLTLYFAHSMAMELRASDNRTAAAEADQAIAGAARYLTNLLANVEEPGQLPDLWAYRREAVPVGEAQFWVIGRNDRAVSTDRVEFGLVDETSKLNLNNASLEMLEWLPRMTPELAAAIVDWRDPDSEPSSGGAEDETYLRLNPPYRCKNAPFESVEELRLVHGMDLEILYGEDWNQNGILDPNENDGDLWPPRDNRDGKLDPGLIEYFTVFSLQPVTASNGADLVNLAAGSIDRQALATLLEERFAAERANAILNQLGNITEGFTSVLQFYLRSGMTPDEFTQIQGDVVVSSAEALVRVNINTAPEEVLACIPGIGIENAATVVAHRNSIAQPTQSMAWLTDVLSEEAVTTAGPYLTGQTHLFSLDIAAVGHYGRGFRRIRFLCDASGEMPRFVARRDLTSFGWALGRQVRDELQLADKSQIRR